MINLLEFIANVLQTLINHKCSTNPNILQTGINRKWSTHFNFHANMPQILMFYKLEFTTELKLGRTITMIVNDVSSNSKYYEHSLSFYEMCDWMCLYVKFKKINETKRIKTDVWIQSNELVRNNIIN